MAGNNIGQRLGSAYVTGFAVLGFMLLSCFGQQRELFFLSIATLGALTAYLSATSGNGYMYKIGYTVAIIITLAGGLSDASIFHLAVLRLQETLLGVICFSAIFSLLWPEKNLYRLRTKAAAEKIISGLVSQREGALRAIKFFCFIAVSWALWIYLPIPGGFIFPMLASAMGLNLIEYPAKVINKLIVIISLLSLIILFEYVFILPRLSAGWQLAAFYFVNCFAVWRIYDKPEQSAIRVLGGMFLVTLTMSAQYLRPVYAIHTPLQMLVILIIIMLTVKLVMQAIDALIAR